MEWWLSAEGERRRCGLPEPGCLLVPARFLRIAGALELELGSEPLLADQWGACGRLKVTWRNSPNSSVKVAWTSAPIRAAKQAQSTMSSLVVAVIVATWKYLAETAVASRPAPKASMLLW